MRDIIETILAKRERIFARISAKQLARYDFLQQNLQSRNVSTDREYQRTFNSFYRVQRRKPEWYAFFYDLLEQEKTNSQITFEGVLKCLYAALGRVEPSFASKLVATVRPEAPVYDAFVRENLRLSAPAQHKSPEARIAGFIELYTAMERYYGAALADENLMPAIDEFDRHFPDFAHFTKLKKLDLMLWQMR